MLVLAKTFFFLQYPEHNLNRLNERLILFRHDYGSTNILLPINAASEVTEGTLVEIIVSGQCNIFSLLFDILLENYKK